MSSEYIPFLPIDKFTDEKILSKLEQIKEENVSADASWTTRSKSFRTGSEFSEDVAFLLCGLGLEKYLDQFKKEDISLHVLKLMTERDLKILGLDSDDREKILKHFSGYSERILPAHDCEADFLIVRNMLLHCLKEGEKTKQLLLKMRKTRPRDYFVTDSVKATAVLKSLTEKAIQQSQRITNTLYSKGDMSGLINIITGKKYPLSNQRLSKKRILILISALTVCSVGCIIARMAV